MKKRSLAGLAERTNEWIRQVWWPLRYRIYTGLFSLKSKLILIFSLLFVGVMFAVSILSLNQQKAFLMEEVEKRGVLISENLAMSSRDALLAHDLLALSALIGAVQKEGGLSYAFIVDRQNIVVMHTDVSKIASRYTASGPQLEPARAAELRTVGDLPPTLEISRPISYGEKVIGYAYIGLNRSPVERMIDDAKVRLVKTMGFGLLLGGFGILVLSSLLLRPVAHLVKATEELAHGNLEIWVPAKSRDELGQLGVSFNAMVNRLKEAYEGVEHGYLETTRALAAAVEAKDPYTRGHCHRVSRYSVEIGKRLGFGGKELKELEFAATLHDIGKIGIKDEVLVKPTRLSWEEMRLMHLHPEIGRRILEKVDSLREIAYDILCHHEFINGKGYPQALKGDEIPVVSRIITVADSYDAMASKRVYRDTLAEEEIRKRLQEGKGRQFDPALVEAFLDLCDAGVIEKIRIQYPEHR